MNYKDAYYHLFNRITTLIEQLEGMQRGKEEVNVIVALQQLQKSGEEVCISDRKRKAPRVGATQL